MTARESPQRRETCLHLCISHINKFSHRCIQTSLSALLHTTHSCHKHSDTQSTTTEGEREREKEGEKGEREREEREKAKEGVGGMGGREKGSGGRWRRGESETGAASGEMLRWECWGGPTLRNCAQRSVWPSRNLLKAGRPAWMKEKWALVGWEIDKGRSGGLRVANTLNAWNIRTTWSFHEIDWARLRPNVRRVILKFCVIWGIAHSDSGINTVSSYCSNKRSWT